MRDANKKLFGEALRALRREYRETIADVSGAVEIEPRLLNEIENGRTMPSEDIVMLLISHFSLKDDEAIKLWSLAGFDKVMSGLSVAADQAYANNPVLYTDMIQVSANNYGVVINFLQGLNSEGKPSAVARVGMSRKHAQSIVDVLSKALNSDVSSTRPKELSDGKR